MNQRDQFSEFDFDAAPAAEPEATKEEPQMVPKERLDEALQQNAQLAASREDIIKSMLNGSAGPATAPDAENPLSTGFEPVFPEGTEDAVKELLTPILKQNLDLAVKTVQGSVDQRVAPVEEKIGFAEAVESVRGRIEGFDEIKGDIVQLFRSMSPEDQEEHNSKLGLEVMALRVLRNRKVARSTRPGMAHSAPANNQGLGTGGGPSGPSEADIWKMTDAEFENYLAKEGASPSG